MTTMAVPIGNKRMRIVVADDHQPVLREVIALLTEDFDIVAASRDGLSLVSDTRKHHPDVIVTDIQMPGLDGITASRILLQENACRGAVVLTTFSDHSLVEAAQDAGIRGYVSKLKAGHELIEAIHVVVSGEWFVSSDLHFIQRR